MKKPTDLPGASVPVLRLPEPTSIDPRITAAIRTINKAWSEGTAYDLASQAAFALHEAGMLTPQAPAATVTDHVEAAPSPQAVFWTNQCQRAVEIAAELENGLIGGTGVAVVADHDRVTVGVDPTMDGAADDLWDFVLLQLGITETRVQGWFLVADAVYKGEKIRVVGHGMVDALPAVAS